ncbi:unnamed protein product, partial [Prorocentrum cordatum]
TTLAQGFWHTELLPRTIGLCCSTPAAMNRVLLSAFAVLLASRGCIASGETTTMEDRRLLETTTADGDPPDVTGAAARSGGLGTMLLALLSTTMANERRLLETTTADGDPPDVTGAAARSGGLGTMLLALLTFLSVGHAAGAAVDESTTMANERRLLETTTADGDPPDVTGAAPRSAVQTAPALALAAALGLAARR